MTDEQRERWDAFRAQLNRLAKLDPERVETYLNEATENLRVYCQGIEGMKR